jgi:hypothetical protein
MDATFHNALAAHGATLITHIGLVNGSNIEISGGSYARQAVTWSGASNVKSPSGNLVFNIPAGSTVAGWRGYSASSGGTNYGGAALSSVTFNNAGTYTLLAASTNFTVQAGT